MRKFKGTVAAEARGGNEKLKLAVMTVGLGLVVVAWFMTLDSGRQDADAPSGFETVGSGRIAMPQLLPGTLDAFADGTEDERVLLERQPLEVLLGYTRRLTAAHLEAVAPERLDDPATLERLATAPAEARGEFFAARGEILALRPSDETFAAEHWLSTLSLESGALVHVLTPRLEDPDAAVGDFARIDGLFVKRFVDEVDGEWREGPLLVGPRLMRSYADFGSVAALDASVWAEVVDDTLDTVAREQSEVRWRALAWMRDLPEGAIDWDNAQVLDAETMDRIQAQPAEHRGQPFRLEIGLPLLLTQKSVGENPARLSTISEGWLYRTDFPDRAPVFMFEAPGDMVSGLENQKVAGDFVFVRNKSVVTDENVRRIVPLFVAHRFGVAVEEAQTGLYQFKLGFVSFAVVLTVLILLLWRRDQRRSKVLHEKLVERRRARRARTAGQLT